MSFLNGVLANLYYTKKENILRNKNIYIKKRSILLTINLFEILIR